MRTNRKSPGTPCETIVWNRRFKFRFYKRGERQNNATPYCRGWLDGRELCVRGPFANKTEAVRAYSEAVEARLRDNNSGQPVQGATFGEVAAAYLTAKKLNGKNDERYLDRLRGVEVNGTRLGDIPIADILPMHIDAAVHGLYATCKAATANRQGYVPAAAVLHYAAQNELCAYRVISKLTEEPSAVTRPDTNVIDDVLAELSGVKRAFLVFLILQGPRVTEALAMRREDVSFPTQQIRIYVSKSRSYEWVPLADATLELLRTLDKRDDGFLWPWRTRSGVYKWLAPIKKRLGVQITPHMLRHEFASRLHETGATTRDMVDVGTWTSQKSVERYVTAHDAHKRDIINRPTQTTKRWVKANAG